MRVYVPAVLSDLSVPLPPVRSGVLCVPEAGMSGEDIEVLEDDAITETTLTPGEQIEPHIFEAPAFEYTWSDGAAILADLPDASPAVQAVLSADTQEDADEAVAALWESSLAWFDRSERPAVLALHQG